jgi:predicted nucleic-acid-binding Zn-ribbon protein
MLAKHSAGLPSQLTAGLHPCILVKPVTMARSSMLQWVLLPTRILSFQALNFISILDSSTNFGITPGNRVVTSYDENNTYLIIVCTKARYTWIFFQASKSTPMFIIERFLAMHGLNTGPIFLRISTGKLWRSNKLREVTTSAGYAMEPTDSEVESQNGKVEQPNGTFGAMVRCLLYSAGVSEI